MKKFQDLAKNFSQNPTNRGNYADIVALHSTEVPRVGIQRDLNKTRIEARHKLARSSLRCKKGILYYQVSHQPTGFPTSQEWDSLREIEGVLNAAHPIVVLSQFETKFVAGFGPLVKLSAYKSLCSENINLIDVDTWGVKTHPTRSLVDTADFTEIGLVSYIYCNSYCVQSLVFKTHNIFIASKQSLQRATLELERRFMSNTNDLLTFKELGSTDMSMSWTKRERAAAYLDPRLNLKLAVVTTSEWKVTKSIMKEDFTKFTVTCKAFCQKNMH